MKKKMTIVVLLAVVMTLPVLFSGCTSPSNNTTSKAADVILEGVMHHETFELPSQHISTVFFTLQNKGNAIARNVNLYVIVDDTDGIEVYNKEVTINSSLNPGEENIQSIDVPYNIDDTQLDLNISIVWGGGVNQYTRSLQLEFKEYTDVILASMTHHESYDLLNEYYTTSVNFVLQNAGNLIAENVKILVIIHDNKGNEKYNKEENVVPLILPWEVKTYNIIIPYYLDDTRLNLSIIVSWDGGANHYNRSFEPEFEENANVKLEGITHYETYKLFVGYISTVTFILQNKGSGTADNVMIGIIANDDNGNELYNSEVTVTSLLIPGEITFHEIAIPYNFNDTRLNLSIIVSWDGGANHYNRSFEPKIFF